ncbi:MAG: hypothetical protein DRN53_05790 [Thermoprotei archaeon]|nr:MAG: hypothetical protein DRN53_05790 [Thermoprotei archaeon]
MSELLDPIPIHYLCINLYLSFVLFKGGKKNVVLYLDPEVVREAKELGLNLSKVCEKCAKRGYKKG